MEMKRPFPGACRCVCIPEPVGRPGITPGWAVLRAALSLGPKAFSLLEYAATDKWNP